MFQFNCTSSISVIPFINKFPVSNYNFKLLRELLVMLKDVELECSS